MKHSRTRFHAPRGFTLIELMLYAGLVAIMTSAIAALLVIALQSRARHQVIEVVESTGAIVMDDITTTVRNADAVTVGVDGDANPQITITTFDLAATPVVYTALASGTVTKKVGSDAAVPLSPDLVDITDFTAAIESSSAETQKLLNVQFRAGFDDATNRAEYGYNREFSGAALIRTP